MDLLRTSALFSAALVSWLPVAAVQAGDLAQEYDQVRKIALKDPKVREAFDRATEKLNKRILEIDPALKPFVEGQRRAGKTGETKKPSESSAQTTHVVSKGETLTSIAKHYGVGIYSLTTVNGVDRNATLRIGQKLVIPSKR